MLDISEIIISRLHWLTLSSFKMSKLLHISTRNWKKLLRFVPCFSFVGFSTGAFLLPLFSPRSKRSSKVGGRTTEKLGRDPQTPKLKKFRLKLTECSSLQPCQWIHDIFRMIWNGCTEFFLIPIFYNYQNECTELFLYGRRGGERVSVGAHGISSPTSKFLLKAPSPTI